MKFKINLKYFLLTTLIFLVEVLIATVLKDQFFIRAYLGDVIVVILLYTLVKSFFVTNDTKLILGIFAFSCLIEFAQFFNIAEKLGFQPGSLMYIIVGNSFSWIDIVCYGVGCLIIYLLTKIKSNHKKSKKPV
ncbi:ribosomal maturation YjgA family protein [Chryseobacterium chendengshani]|uniref:ribosomal maturation YjgA family protein n=1 Tax=Chryseobacterium sp. LJ756 TaxID=2864113 RepID=UPI001C63EFC9|nr:DUF2809 domain-containing protein [Chryseobacterium sp. LJ756]MBW7675391.1 DUF2809 domain-containing protein [Chryseobacterium sp. LJ756]